MEKLSEYWENLVPLVSAYLPKLLLAILFLLVGIWVIKKLNKVFRRVLELRSIDESLRPFLVSIVSTLFKILLFISVAGMVGIEMTSFIALIGAAGLAVGMALSGSLQNFAGGVMILLFKPFKAGDFIEAQGYSGVVKEIQIFNTLLTTPDNKIVILPNGGLSGSSMVNYSALPTRRVDFSFGIGYDDDIDHAKEVLQKIIDSDTRILKDPEAFVAVGELADSSVNFTVRVWVNTADYWGVYFDMQEKVKKEFDANNLSIPYPQTDVHLHK